MDGRFHLARGKEVVGHLDVPLVAIVIRDRQQQKRGGAIAGTAPLSIAESRHTNAKVGAAIALRTYTTALDNAVHAFTIMLLLSYVHPTNGVMQNPNVQFVNTLYPNPSRLLGIQMMSGSLTMSDREMLLDILEANRKPAVFKRERPNNGDFPQLIVTVPDEWPKITLAPLYDVHIGSSGHDAVKFERHVKWIEKTPHVLTFNGGDFIENATKLSPGGSVYDQLENPNNQLVRALKIATRIQHKMLFSLPGNHEQRTGAVAGVDSAMWFSQMLRIPYFKAYCMCTIKWRGNNFRILAHHGSGAAQTAGAQRMAARKDVSWAKPFDLIWTGHLHAPLADAMFQTDFNQQTGLVYERNGLVLISPSYMNYFGGYGAQKRYAPGTTGLISVDLQEDGRMDVQIYANSTLGKRL